MPAGESSQNKNLNVPAFWDKEFKKEWKSMHSNELPKNTCDYRWDSFRFGALGWQIPQGGKVLDIGCGLGHFCRYLRAKCFDAEIWGMDFSPWAIKRAKQLAARTGMKIKYVLGDAQNLSFEDNSFDTVVAMEIIEHLSDPERFLEKAKKILRPGGRLLLTTPWRGLLTKDGGLISEEHVQEWTPQEMADLIKKHFGGGEILFPPILTDRITGKHQQVFWFMAVCTKQHA